MACLPQEILDHIVIFIKFDLQTLINIRLASTLFHHSTNDINNILQKYVSIFNTPLTNENNTLLINDMKDHLAHMEYNNISIEKARLIDSFIKSHNDIDYDVPCTFARGKCSILLNLWVKPNLIKYLLYLGANPNCTTSKDGYTIVNMIMRDYDDIDEKANLFALLIEYNMDINLADYDVGESMNSYFQQNPILYQKVLSILGVSSL
jgi:hypothetical protein